MDKQLRFTIKQIIPPTVPTLAEFSMFDANEKITRQKFPVICWALRDVEWYKRKDGKDLVVGKNEQVIGMVAIEGEGLVEVDRVDEVWDALNVEFLRYITQPSSDFISKEDEAS